MANRNYILSRDKRDLGFLLQLYGHPIEQPNHVRPDYQPLLRQKLATVKREGEFDIYSITDKGKETVDLILRLYVRMS